MFNENAVDLRTFSPSTPNEYAAKKMIKINFT